MLKKELRLTRQKVKNQVEQQIKTKYCLYANPLECLRDEAPTRLGFLLFPRRRSVSARFCFFTEVGKVAIWAGPAQMELGSNEMQILRAKKRPRLPLEKVH